MNALALGALLVGVAMLAGGNVQRGEKSGRERMRELITTLARTLGVPVPVALAFAEVESALNPAREGDLDWPTRNGGALYKRLVRDATHFAANPWRNDPSRWHAYGLFQLLAPYYTGPTEDPRALLVPEENARRALTTIASLLRRYNGDDEAARIHYVCGSQSCSDAKRAQILTRYREAKAKHREAA